MPDRSNIASQKPIATPPAPAAPPPAPGGDPAAPPAPRTSAIVTGGHNLRDDAFSRAMAALGGEEPSAPAAPPPAAPASPPPAQAGGSPPPGASAGAPPAPAAGGTPPPAAPVQAGPEWERFLAEQRRVGEESARVQATAAALAEQQARWAKQSAAYEKIASGDVQGGLADLGTSYGDLTAQVISGKGGKKPAATAAAPPAASAIPPEVQKQLEELAQWKTSQTQLQERNAAQEAWNQIGGTIRSIVAADTSDRWDLLKSEPKYEERVYDLMDQAWVAAGRPATPPLTYEAAADKVEAFLVEDVKRRGQSAKTKALLGIGASPANTPPPGTATSGTSPANPPAPTANRGPTTLSSSMSAEVTRQPATADPGECRKRALAVLEGKE